MDQARFDRMARLFGAAANRRAVLAAAGALLGGAAAAELAAAGRKGPRAEGPCGDGSRKDNICTKDKQCCTGICDRKTGKTNQDGKGRCRCIRKGGECTDDRNCCSRGGQQLVCSEGRCARPGPAGVPTGDTCTEADFCLASAAQCTTYFSGDPAGTRCLLPLGAACAAADECTSQRCDGGVCAPELCTVCDSGCPYSDLDSAIAAASGSPILIDAGTWQTTAPYFATGVIVRSCNRAAVTIQGTAADGALFLDDPNNGTTLTVADLTVTNTTPDGKCVVVQGGYANVPGLALRNVTLSNCPGGGVHLYATVNATIASSVITGCTADTAQSTNRGGGLYASNGPTNDPMSIRISDTTFSGNTAGAQGGAIWANKSTITLARVSISGNTATSAGGGILLDGENNQVTLTVEGSGTLVTGNTAPEASGIGVRTPANVTVNGVTDANVSGNITGANCETTPDGTTWTQVACSAL